MQGVFLATHLNTHTKEMGHVSTAQCAEEIAAGKLLRIHVLNRFRTLKNISLKKSM